MRRFPILIVLCCLCGAACSKAPAPASTPTAATAPSDQPFVPEYVLEGGDPTIPDWVGRRTSEPFPVRAFLESRLPPEDNAAPLYLKAFSWGFLGFEYLIPEADRAAYTSRANGILESIHRFSDVEWLKDHSGDDEVDRFLLDCQPLFDLVDRAQERSRCVFIAGLQYDSLLPHGDAASTFSKLCMIEIATTCSRADLLSAERAIRRGLRLSRDLRPRGPLVIQMVSRSAEATILGATCEFYLTCPGLTANDCDRLLEILKEHLEQGLDLAEEGLLMAYVERAHLLAAIQSGKNVDDLMNLKETPLSVVNFDVEWDYLNRLHRLLHSALGPARMVSRYEQFVDPEVSMLYSEHERWISENSRTLKFRWKKVNVPVVVPQVFYISPLFLETASRQREHIRATILITGVKRHFLLHGALPESLQVVADELGLAGVPQDPYDGEPFRFAVIDGKPVVYSVGPDLIDQQGELDWDFGKQPGDIRYWVPLPAVGSTDGDAGTPE